MKKQTNKYIKPPSLGKIQADEDHILRKGWEMGQMGDRAGRRADQVWNGMGLVVYLSIESSPFPRLNLSSYVHMDLYQ